MEKKYTGKTKEEMAPARYREFLRGQIRQLEKGINNSPNPRAGLGEAGKLLFELKEKLNTSYSSSQEKYEVVFNDPFGVD